MSHTNFLGIPVEGDITRGDKREKQRPIEDLQPLLEAVLADPFIVEFGWRQYTPYFNDGDPCTFRVNSPWFRTTADVKEDDEDGYEDTEDLEVWGHRTLSPREWNTATSTYDYRKLAPEVSASAERVEALAQAIDGGEFDDVLLDAFGDHANVTVKATGINVEFYEHD